MKIKRLSIQILVALLFSTVSFFVSCDGNDESENEVFTVDENGSSSFHGNQLKNELDNFPYEDLSSTEEQGLLFMREEEKLAQDVYSHLYGIWNTHIFNNISKSEATHTEAIRLLLNKYNLKDPADGNGNGIFVDSDLQKLYDDLTDSGETSEIEALKVGALIEEIDILDLDMQLNQIVNNQDIIYVYENLQRSSRNHLRAFVKVLKNRGVTYEPLHLSIEDYNSIINSSNEHGG